MVELTAGQLEVVDSNGHLLVTGGPGSGKTTVSILKAARIVTEDLRPEQRVLFLSFARATVSRVLEAIDEEKLILPAVRKRIEVDTYHSFFWSILKTYGYLIGLPRILNILTPPNEAIALSSIRSEFKAVKDMTEAEKLKKSQRENDERTRLAMSEGIVCFDLFATYVQQILSGSQKIRSLISNSYPFVILDEFQDTNEYQWGVMKAVGVDSTLISLADPEQRIYDFIGADPERLNHFKNEFNVTEFDLSADNHRSGETEIAIFGNDILRGQLSRDSYNGIVIDTFEANNEQALTKLHTTTLQARKRLINSAKKNWSLAVLVPTKKMTRMISDTFRAPFGELAAIQHHAVVDMDAAILASEVVAFLLQPMIELNGRHVKGFVEIICSFYRGKGGNTPSKTNLNEADCIEKAFQKAVDCVAKKKAIPKNSIFLPILQVLQDIKSLPLTGNPEQDWLSVRRVLENGTCTRLNKIASEVKNVRLLDRGAELRSGLSQNWRDNGVYQNALEIVRQSFVQEHFSTSTKPENGVVVMNMHKAKGKQFDEVIIFEGWPIIQQGQIVSNPNRFVRSNFRDGSLNQARQNFRVSVTRAKSQTTILTPRADRCVLL